ncbi:hypothetical protein [Rhodopila sp.]|uniref:hypothetical protein n=1 Tax=Rhodopila sp. TaxID=2480087 RepID=UPI003D13F841
MSQPGSCGRSTDLVRVDGATHGNLVLARFAPSCTMHRMTSFRACWVVPVLLLGVSGCAYDPPVQGEHTSDRYKADLQKCRTSSTEAVRLKNAGTLESWIISPVTGPPAVRAAIRTCMASQGYVLRKPRD